MGRLAQVELLLLHWPNPRIPRLQQNVAAIPRNSKIERLSENIELFDFELSDEEMHEISAMGSAKARLTDFGFAPRWD